MNPSIHLGEGGQTPPPKKYKHALYKFLTYILYIKKQIRDLEAIFGLQFAQDCLKGFSGIQELLLLVYLLVLNILRESLK